MKLQLLINIKKGDVNIMKRNSKLNLMEMLPMELLVEILKRVPAKSVCRIRCVCKMLLSLVDSPSFVKLHSTFLLDPDKHATPECILHYGLSRQGPLNRLSTFHSLHYELSNAQDASKLKPRRILHCNDPYPNFYSLQFVFCNMFCITCPRDHELAFLINPLRGEVLKLPPSYRIAEQVCGPNSKATHVSTGMGFDSMTNTYKILRVTDMEKYWVVQVLVLGTSEWRQVPSAPPPGISLRSSKNNICAHGDMHWLVYDYTREGIQGHVHILSFDFKKGEFFWISNPYILRDGWRLHLITFKGSMAIVDATSGTNIEIWLMKDYNKKQWMLDHSINIPMLELNSEFKFHRAACCEWEHGILFIDELGTITWFLNLRGPTITKYVLTCPMEGDLVVRHIKSLHGSLISLKSYANLRDAEEPTTYSNWSQGEASEKSFFYLTT